MFLDDGIGGDQNYELALKSSEYTKQTILEFGFLLADEKCNWLPSRCVTWLGHILDMENNLLFISEERIQRFESVLDSCIYQVKCCEERLLPVKHLAGVVGHIISLQSVIGNKVRLMTREMFKCINSRASWNACILVSVQALEELIFWKENVRLLNQKGKNLKHDHVCLYNVFIDASDVGYGGYIEKAEVFSNFSEKLSSSMIHCECLSQYFSHDAQGELLTERSQSFPEVDSMGKVDLFPDVNFLDLSPEVDTASSIVISRSPEMDTANNIVTKWSQEVDIENSITKKWSPEVDTASNLVIRWSPEVDQASKCVAKCTPEVDKANKISMRKFQAVDKTSPIMSQNEGISGKNVNRSPEVDSCSEVVGQWSEYEQSLSSTWRETEAVNRVIHSHSNILKNAYVKVFSDNKNVKSVLVNGSKTQNIHSSVVELNTLCEKENIVICPEWIPREDNERADFLSRCYDCDDWSVSSYVFQYLNHIWGPYSIDRFASHLNNKCIKFNSRWWVPGTDGVDALSESWQHHVNWLVPPPRLVVKCIHKIMCEGANCTLVLPFWKSAPFWPCLFDYSGKHRKFIKGIINLGRKDVIWPGKGKNGCFSKNPLAFDMLALKCIP
ncbi:uncharacterized protein LOC132749862 [Ruditapes philippinarum]|uniref:uncharacterized protein LOC132749862 n=1 Tax=Ruditapes philippinarum TaxID=129788 RepID=UPI00295B389E|nr:uncharacterized protein LOC132749862 [Ruditapes philippinarum]